MKEIVVDLGDDTVDRPELTLPPQAAEHVRKAYNAANVILEYGSGGSTILAAECGEKTVFSVESDPNWAVMMEEWFRQNPTSSSVHIHHVNIGLVKAWGYPRNNKFYTDYPDYCYSVWEREDFQHPDVILIDGRFRVGCFIAAMLLIERPVTVLMDDYIKRPKYKVVENFFPLAAMSDRMARFELVPRRYEPKELGKLFKLSLDTL